MEILRQHLEILFSRIRPETLIDNLKYNFIPEEKRNEVTEPLLKIYDTIPEFLTYQHFSGDIYRNLSHEEVEMRYNNLTALFTKNSKNVFFVLPKYTCRILKERGSEIECRFENLLNWRECYFVLGQDLLTTSHLAYKDVEENRHTSFFGWSALIGTDNRRLQSIMREGIAENHFHLNGSSRFFDLSWICMMNHPNRIKSFFAEKKVKNEKIINELFKENLNSNVSLGKADNCLSWQDKLMLACWLRAALFDIVMQQKNPNIKCSAEYIDDKKSRFLERANQMQYQFTNVGELNENVSMLRYVYGNGGRFPQPGGDMKCLDYAITSDIAKYLPKSCCCRSLAGERAFMYHALRLIYSGGMYPKQLMDIFTDFFYLYILIKTQFRGELIQVNGKLGFKNFAKYQDRKDIIFENFDEYILEALNLSVNDSFNHGCVTSLEARIAPKSDYISQCLKIKETDDKIRFLNNADPLYEDEQLKKAGMSDKLFYVLHFVKTNETLDEMHPGTSLFSPLPRNSVVRNKTKKETFSIAKAIEKYDWLCTRIRGIDACNFEIGCRPEVFASCFRFLRAFVPDNTERDWANSVKLRPRLSITYHVGEDFMDIANGLRAIDEAVTFLEMESGDRLGHAVVMGTNPNKYYSLKNHHLIMHKQERLDDIVWLLNRSTQLGVNIDGILKQELKDDAEKLIMEIYGKRYTILDYYCSWKLRGDDPELYLLGKYDDESYRSDIKQKMNSISKQYAACRIMSRYEEEKYSDCRNNHEATELYMRYHFDNDAKQKGNGVMDITIGETYIAAMYEMQEKMRKEIAKKRIGIECNPSSNMLIGPFDKYEQIPLFTFVPVEQNIKDPVQFASINTDDQGVFDTSLSMEYALVAATLCQTSKYNDETIYNYIKRLRENGLGQIFPQTSDGSLSYDQSWFTLK